ncbi:MAG: AraC family transcriptional regulator [Clostridia bacterium]|nr:AraC family transcriptional regulator [Clostridia bacterium]
MIDHVERAKQYIHRQMGVTGCDEVARAMNLSRKYLNNLFVRFRGQSLQTYIMTVRMNYAADLLMSGDYISKEIAAAVGYSDYAQFSKMFKKYHHLAPSDYARARRQ